jgi:hypothetical protein
VGHNGMSLAAALSITSAPHWQIAYFLSQAHSLGVSRERIDTSHITLCLAQL